MFNSVPRGFIPTQDKLYLIGMVKLPEGASIERTYAVVQKVKDITLHTDGVAHVISFAGSTRVSSVTPQTTAWPSRS